MNETKNISLIILFRLSFWSYPSNPANKILDAFPLVAIDRAYATLYNFGIIAELILNSNWLFFNPTPKFNNSIIRKIANRFADIFSENY